MDDPSFLSSTQDAPILCGGHLLYPPCHLDGSVLSDIIHKARCAAEKYYCHGELCEKSYSTWGALAVHMNKEHCRSILYRCKSKNTVKNCTNAFFDPSAASRCKHESGTALGAPSNIEDSRPSLRKAELRRQQVMDLLLKEHAHNLKEPPAFLASHIDYPEWKERTQRYFPKSSLQHQRGRQAVEHNVAQPSGHIPSTASLHAFNPSIVHVLRETSKRSSENLVAYAEWFLSHFPVHLRTAEAIERHLWEHHQFPPSSTSSEMHPCISGMCFIAPSEMACAGAALVTAYSPNTHLLPSPDSITRPSFARESRTTDSGLINYLASSTTSSSAADFFSAAYDLQGEWERYSQSS